MQAADDRLAGIRRRNAAKSRRYRERVRHNPPAPQEWKPCQTCGSDFARPLLIADSQWAARRFCSLACYHAAARLRKGEETSQWKGDAAGQHAGNARARVLYPELGACVRCGNQAELRHHVDENTLNNEPENIEFLCRACHVAHHDPIAARWGN